MLVTILRSIGLELTLIQRAFATGLTSLLIAVLSGRWIIAWLCAMKVGERAEKTPIEDEVLRARISSKSGTPTMGGVIPLAALVIASLLWCDLANAYLWMVSGCFVVLAGVGALDDWLKLIGREHAARGLKARHKLAIQFILGVALGGAYWLRHCDVGSLALPDVIVRDWVLALGPLSIVVVAVIVTTMSNAVNVTDGMDGLAAGLTIAALVPLGMMVVQPGFTAGELVVVDLAAHEMLPFCAALGGAMLGFLWYNAHPAEVFMGDTGALAVGGALGMVAVIVRADLWLLVIGGVFLAEFGSSVLQVLWFKATGRRILPIAPLHHIWQKRGMPETRLVTRFWIAGLVLALTALAFI